MGKKNKTEVIVISKEIYLALQPLEQMAAQALPKVRKIKIVYEDSRLVISATRVIPAAGTFGSMRASVSSRGGSTLCFEIVGLFAGFHLHGGHRGMEEVWQEYRILCRNLVPDYY